MTTKSARIAAIAIVAATGVLIALLAAVRLLHRTEAHVDVDRSRYPVVGIDLSAHNGIPDFDSIATVADFVYLKASEGLSLRDAMFARNYAAARRVGIPVGAYHFFRFDCDGRGQAVNLLESTEGCSLDLPVAIDVEEFGNPPDASTEIIIERLASMVLHLRSTGHKVIIYTNKNGDARFLRQHFDNIEGGDPELWICSFTDPPINRRPWRLWQHSHRAAIPGVKGHVDLNTFNGSREQWKLWLDAQ